jgi:CheY-like chemotaxis protein
MPYLTRCHSNPDIFHKSQKKHFITNTKKYNIFICDDERQMALSTKNLFMKYFKSKYNEDSLPEIFIVNDGIQCLYQAYQFYLEDNQCNLIIMDQNMNFMNGDVACKIIKQTKQLENIAVYLITSDDASYFTSCNANGVFSKPITASHIETILHKQFFD